jgi:hypothetical protein
LQTYRENIEHNVRVQNYQNHIGKQKGEKDEKEPAEKPDDLEMRPVDSDQIKSIVNLIDEFNNVVAKNYAVYGQYDDFSFANSRSSVKMLEKLEEFFKTHFSGDF